MLISTVSAANTVLGGNITWACLGGNQYQIRLTAYMDCYGYDQGAIPSIETIFAIPSGCSNSMTTYDLSFVSSTQISDLCPSELAFSSCSGGANQGVIQFIYEGLVTLPANCQWTLVWSNLYWGYFINANEFSHQAYIHSMIDTNYPCSDSPTIVSTPSAPQTPYFCQNTSDTHTIALNNLPSGYTTTYTILPNLVLDASVLAPPITSNGWSMPTGLTNVNETITWTPSASNITLNGFRVEIQLFDGSGNHVGTINENMIIYVRDCSVTDTHFSTPPVSSTGTNTTLSGSNNITVCAGDSLIFTVRAENSNALRAITISETPIAGLPLVSAQQGSNPAEKTYTLLTTNAHVGTYTLYLHASDDACPNPDTDDTSVNITVYPNVSLNFADSTICHGESINLVASGQSPSYITWSAISGDMSFSPVIGSATQTVSPNVTTQYVAHGSGIPPACHANDTAIVRVRMTDLTYTKTDETCGNNNGSINLTVQGEPSPNLIYAWTPNSGGITQNAEDQTGLNGGATYTVVVTDTLYGCTLNKSITIGDVPSPSLVFSGDTTICATGCANLTIQLTQGSAPFSVTGNHSPFPINATNTTHTFSVCPTTTTTYTVTGVTDASNCSASINQSVTVTVRPVVTASFDPITPLCLGDNLGLDITFSESGTYNVTYNITTPTPTTTGYSANNIADGIITSAPNPTIAGNYTYDITGVQYTTAPFCPSTDAANPSIQTTVNPLPVATLSGTATICSGDCHDLTIALTGTGPWTVGYTLNGTAQTPLLISNSTYTWNVCPSGTSTYCITSVQDANCTNSTITGQCATVTVAPYPTLTNYTVSDTDICEGEDATLEVNFGPSGNTACLYFTASPTESAFALPFCSQPSSATFSVLASPTVNTVYCLDSITFAGAPQCATVANICRTVNVHSDITATQTNLVCNNIGTQYQVTYTLSNGGPTYTEQAGGGSGSFDAMDPSIYTTDWVNNGSGGPWIFSDIYACNTLTMDTIHTCPVLTESGTMVSNPITICGNGLATATHNGDEYLDGNDELMFILYTNASNPLAPGSVINQNCATPEFSFDSSLSMSYGTTYYIAAVAGDEGTPGCVDLTAANLQISNATSVIWYEIPTATLTAPGDTSACSGSCVPLEIALTGVGPWNVSYNINNNAGLPALPQIPANTPGGIYSFCSDSTGTHTLATVSNAYCTGTVSGNVNVLIHPLPTATLDGNAGTCSGSDHYFEITLSGSAPWDVIIDNPGSTNDTLTQIATSPDNTSYSANAAGNYQIISVTDSNGCSNLTPSTAATLTVYSLPVVQWVTGDTTFCENSTVDLNYAITSGTGPFSITFNTPDPDVITPTNNASATGLITVDEIGTYEITGVTDANNCTSLNGATINVGQINTPIANAGPDMDACVGVPITIGTASQPNHSYIWSPATPGISPGSAAIAQPIVTLTTANTTQQYVVHAQVAQCTATDTMVVTTHGLPNFNLSALADSLCANTCTDIQATAIGGGTLTYDWASSPSIQNADLTNNPITICPSSNETFSVTAYEVHGLVTCQKQMSIDITVGNVLAVDEQFTQEVCNGTCEGEIHLTPSGGFGPYTLDPNSDITSLNATSLCPGIYSYTVHDAIGCSYTSTITIQERAPEVIDDITVTQPTCYYDLGEIQVNNAYTSYILSAGAGCTFPVNPDTNTTGLFENIPPCDSPYTITATFQVSSNEYCQTSTTVLIQPQSPEILFNPTWTSEEFCYNEQACFDANPTGGSGSLEITWHSCNNTDGSCLVTTASPYCTPITDNVTLYGVATDAFGCNSNVEEVVATLAPAIVLTVQNGVEQVEICENDCLDLIASVSGGNGNIAVDWYQSPNTPIGNGSPFTYCPLINTTYYAIAHDGCSQDVTDSLEIIVHETPQVLFDTDIYEGCYPQTVHFSDLSAPLTDNYTCVWNFGNGVTQTSCGDISYTYPDYGQFYPTYTITTEHNCVHKDTLDVPIMIYGKPQMGFTWEPQPVTVINNEVQMINTTIAAVSYVWNVQGVGTSMLANPSFMLPPRDQSTTEVCLEATTIKGCKDTLCQEIFMESVLQVFVPNSFTPDFEDGNDLNDVFLPIVTGHDPDRYKLWIMNRWGDTVFYSTDSQQAWTGNFNGGSTYVANDTYVWHIECYELDSNEMQVYQGTVTIIR